MTTNQQRPLNDEPLDLLIIGAGIYGIQAARTYLAIHPAHSILVLEADNAPGGVWNKGRIYPHFFTQSPLDMWEFSDKPLVLDDEEKKTTFHECFHAKAFARYLEEYINDHVFDGKPLRERIICSIRIENLVKENDIWKISTSNGTHYTSRKVIDATGLTSQPKIPSLPNSSSFQGLQIHTKDFGRQSSTILQPQNRIIIYGGGKSAGDMAYACANAGIKDIHWVIRKSGNGPATYIPADAPIKKYGNSNAAFHTTLMSSILASIYVPENWWTWFLYRTYVGRTLHNLIWRGVQWDADSRAKYDRSNKNGFANLKPDRDMGLFWQRGSSGVNQRPDFFNIVAEKVRIYREDVERVTSTGLTLADGTDIVADVIIYATGWKATAPYLDPRTAYELGHMSDYRPETSDWRTLEQAADAEVIQRFPMLANAPPKPKTKPTTKTSPFRLYRSIFPTTPTATPPSIAFLGRTELANHTYNAEIQSLFAISVFDKTITLPAQHVMERDIARVNAWMKRRYPTKGHTGSFMFFDVVGYTDQLLEDLGMGQIKKERGLLGPMAASNLANMLTTYVERTQSNAKKTL